MKRFGPNQAFGSPYKPITQIEVPLAGGIQGNQQTMDVMKGVARKRSCDPLVRDLASSLIQNVPSHDYIREAYQIGKWVKDNIRYCRDVQGQEQLIDPLMLLDQASRGEARGDCDDMTMLTCALLLSIGAPNVFFRAVRYDGNSGPYAHIYTVVYDTDANGKSYRLPIDCIIKDQPIGYEISHESGDEIPVSQ